MSPEEQGSWRAGKEAPSSDPFCEAPPTAVNSKWWNSNSIVYTRKIRSECPVCKIKAGSRDKQIGPVIWEQTVPLLVMSTGNYEVQFSPNPIAACKIFQCTLGSLTLADTLPFTLNMSQFQQWVVG